MPQMHSISYIFTHLDVLANKILENITNNVPPVGQVTAINMQDKTKVGHIGQQQQQCNIGIVVDGIISL